MAAETRREAAAAGPNAGDGGQTGEEAHLRETVAGAAAGAGSEGPEKVHVKCILEYLQQDVAKRRQYELFFPYGVFFALLIVLLVVERVDSANTPLFHRNVGVLRAVGAVPAGYTGGAADEDAEGPFFESMSYSTFWKWLRKTVVAVWPPGTCSGPILNDSRESEYWTGKAAQQDPTALNVPLGFMLLRQFRVAEQRCGFTQQLKALPQQLRPPTGRVLNRSSHLCFPKFGTASLQSYQHEMCCTQNSGFECDPCSSPLEFCIHCCGKLQAEFKETDGLAAAGSESMQTCISDERRKNCSELCSAWDSGDTSDPCQTSPRTTPWYSNTKLPQNYTRVVNSIARTGVAADYPEPSMAFTQTIGFNQSLTKALLSLHHLELLKWVDDATRAIFVEFLTFNRPTDLYAFTSLCVERLATNNYVTSVKSIPFRIVSLTATDRPGTMTLIFVLDILIILMVVADLLWFAYLAKSDRDILDGTAFLGIGVWGILNCVSSFVFLSAYYYRFFLWFRAWDIDENWYENNRWRIEPDFADTGRATASAPECAEQRFMWEQLAAYAALYDQAATLMACATILAFLRIFAFMQHSEQFNILTETVKLAVGDLFGVVVLGALVVVGFGISAHMLYGDRIPQYRNLSLSIGTLLRTLVSGEANEFEDMEKQHRWEGRFLIFIFYVLAWLILLNLVLAIITGSFAAVQEAAPERTPFQAGELWRYVRARLPFRRCCKRGRCYRRCRRCRRGRAGGAGAAGAKAPAAAGSRRQRPQRQSSRAAEKAAWEQEEEGDTSSGTDSDDETLQYVQNRIKVHGLLQAWAAGPDAATGCGNLSKDVLYDTVVTQGGVPLHRVAVNDIFIRAARRLRAGCQLANEGEIWADRVDKSLDRSRKLKERVENLISYTARINPVAKRMEEIHDKVQSANKSLDEATTSTTKLRERLVDAEKKAGDLDTVLKEVREYSDGERSGGDEAARLHEIDKLIQDTQTLPVKFGELREALDDLTGRLIHDVRRGTFWGPADDDEAFMVVPRLANTSQGRGIVANVQQFSYPCFFPQDEEDVPAQDLVHKDRAPKGLKSVAVTEQLDVAKDGGTRERAQTLRGGRSDPEKREQRGEPADEGARARAKSEPAPR